MPTASFIIIFRADKFLNSRLAAAVQQTGREREGEGNRGGHPSDRSPAATFIRRLPANKGERASDHMRHAMADQQHPFVSLESLPAEEALEDLLFMQR